MNRADQPLGRHLKTRTRCRNQPWCREAQPQTAVPNCFPNRCGQFVWIRQAPLNRYQDGPPTGQQRRQRKDCPLRAVIQPLASHAKQGWQVRNAAFHA